MKTSIIAATLALGLAGAGFSAVAQDRYRSDDRYASYDRSEGRDSWESPGAARKEAAAAWAQAQRECRRERGAEERRSCLALAREDHDHLMEMARGHR